MTILKKILMGLIIVGCSSQIYAYTSSSSSAHNINSSKDAKQSQEGVSIAFVMALDNQEINVSALALQKKLDKPAADYASMLQSDHQSNLKEVQIISSEQNIPAIENASIVEFKKKGAHELDKLGKLDDGKFQTAFLKAMVKGHKEALQKLNKMSKEVSNNKLKEFLKNTAMAVKHHLEQAQSLLKSNQS